MVETELHQIAQVDKFLEDLINYDKDHVPEASRKAVQEYTKKADFDPKLIESKSLAAAGLCAWVLNILSYYEVYCEVEPKRQALNQVGWPRARARGGGGGRGATVVTTWTLRAVTFVLHSFAVRAVFDARHVGAGRKWFKMRRCEGEGKEAAGARRCLAAGRSCVCARHSAARGTCTCTRLHACTPVTFAHNDNEAPASPVGALVYSTARTMNIAAVSSRARC